MGYYTTYDISNNSQEVIDRIHEVSEYSCLQGVKWYDHERDCLQISKEFPDQVISVEGEGEESGDIWKAYYKNGKSFRADAIITFEDFNESKLR